MEWLEHIKYFLTGLIILAAFVGLILITVVYPYVLFPCLLFFAIGLASYAVGACVWSIINE